MKDDTRIRRIAAALLLSILTLLLVSGTCAAGDAETFHVTVGFSSSAFLDVDKERAQAVSALWTDLVARKWGGTAKTRVCGSLAELEQGINAKKIDLVVSLADEYLSLRKRVALEPLFISAKDTEPMDRLILIVRRDKGFRSILALKGKTLVQQKGLFENGRNLWLDTLLMRRGIKSPERFFAKDREAGKPSAAVLPVFFGNTDACVLTRRAFQVMTELNPQLKKDLVILEESPSRPSSVISLRKGFNPLQRKILQEVLENLDRSAQGKQLLTIFRMDRLLHFKASHIIPLEGLLTEYHMLKDSPAKRTL